MKQLSLHFKTGKKKKRKKTEKKYKKKEGIRKKTGNSSQDHNKFLNKIYFFLCTLFITLFFSLLYILLYVSLFIFKHLAALLCNVDYANDTAYFVLHPPPSSVLRFLCVFHSLPVESRSSFSFAVRIRRKVAPGSQLLDKII